MSERKSGVSKKAHPVAQDAGIKLVRTIFKSGRQLAIEDLSTYGVVNWYVTRIAYILPWSWG
jgi:hypothetical protein